MNRQQQIAENNEILRGVVGSTVHGTAISGQDDRDEMGVFIEPEVNVCGLQSCDHYIHRTQPEGVRSGPGDLDLTMYSLRRFCGLAAQGNPYILLLLWLPSYINQTEIGADLVAMRQSFISRNAGERFLGYLTAQKMRMTGERSKTVSRPELVAKYGYDTKFAMHALRLGFQGEELLTYRTISLPVQEPNLTVLRAVRCGEIPYADAVERIERQEIILRHLIEKDRSNADLFEINRFLVKAHFAHWM